MNKNYIWTLPTRVFHWGFVLLILICYLTEDKDILLIHVISGYLLLVFLFFRFGWGFLGPKYSKFKDFPLGINRAKEYIKNIFSKQSFYLGHNPLASTVMISMLVIVLFIIFTGALTYGSLENKGLFSFLLKDKLFKHIHEFFANFLYLLIFLHLAGIAIDRVLHKKTNTLKSIFNGFKYSEKKEQVKLNIFQKIYAFIFLILFICFALYLIIYQSNFLLI